MKDLTKIISEASSPLQSSQDLDRLINFVGDSRIGLLGENTHGSKEFYEWRAWISRRLILEKNFNFIAAEGDWPDCYNVNRFIKAYKNSDENAQEVLKHFNRWPTWMWANDEIEKFIKWLYEENRRKKPDQKIGFYGLDIYSLWTSLEKIINYFKKNNPKLVKIAQQTYECFEPFHHDAQAYAASVTSLAGKSCEKKVIQLLSEIQSISKRYADDKENYFNAEQNALVAKNAEQYYRIMFQGNEKSWNIREKHMAETLDRLLKFHGKEAKAIVWAHNTHIGDARSTETKKLLSLGELVRKKHQKKGVVLIGLSAYQGETIAGEEWGGPMKKISIPPSLPQSWEQIFHDAFGENRLLIFNKKEKASKSLQEQRIQRAIGVVYDPEFESRNYIRTTLSQRYDALLFIDRCTALKPIAVGEFQKKEIPETFPSSF